MVLKTTAVPKFKIPERIENNGPSEADTGDSKVCHGDGADDVMDSSDSTAFNSNDSTAIDANESTAIDETEQNSNDVSSDTPSLSDSLRLHNAKENDPLVADKDPLADVKDSIDDIEENFKSVVSKASNTVTVSPKSQRKPTKLQVYIINLLEPQCPIYEAHYFRKISM